MKRVILLTTLIALSLCFSAAPYVFAAEKQVTPLLTDEDVPFEFTVIDNDETTATLTCSVSADGAYEVIIAKKGAKDHLLITDGTPFYLDLGDTYAVCVKIISKDILYYYDGYASVLMRDGVAVLERDGFVLNTVYEYDNPFESPALSLLEFDTPINIPAGAAAARTESEPNNTYRQANKTNDDDYMKGKISSSGDVDWFVVSFPSAGQANFWLGNIPSGKD